LTLVGSIKKQQVMDTGDLSEETYEAIMIEA